MQFVSIMVAQLLAIAFNKMMIKISHHFLTTAKKDIIFLFVK